MLEKTVIFALLLVLAFVSVTHSRSGTLFTTRRDEMPHHQRIPLPDQREQYISPEVRRTYEDPILGIGFSYPLDYQVMFSEEVAGQEKGTLQGMVVTTEDWTRPRLYLPVPVSLDRGYHPSARSLDEYAQDYLTGESRGVKIHESQFLNLRHTSALRQVYSTGGWTPDGSFDSDGPFEAARELRYVFDCNGGRFFILHAWSGSEDEREQLLDAVAGTFYCLGRPTT